MDGKFRESQSQWWAREYMERSDGKVGETDLAIAFKAGRKAARLNLWHWCSESRPKILTNRRVAVVEFITRNDYEINTVLTSEYADYTRKHACALWAYVDALIGVKLQKDENLL